MILEDLVGKHMLSGVDMDVMSVEDYYGKYEDANVVNFVLDGETYTVTEDPDDGYRSSMKNIIKSDFKVKNTFKPVKVICSKRENGKYDECDILDIVNAKTGKLILAIGTDSINDYYPIFVNEFNPANLMI